MSETTAFFIPPHCPRSDCSAHVSGAGFRWVRYGTYATQGSTERTQRYRCGHCRSTFSATAFTNQYYAKRPGLLVPLAYGALACSGFRQLRRQYRCAPSTLMRLMAKIGRQAMLRMARMCPLESLPEPLVIDGIEGFSGSQFHPCYINVGVGAKSHYTYGFTFSAMRRKGRMTDGQKQRRVEIEAKHGRPDPSAIEMGTAALLRAVCRIPQSVIIHSDEHQAYPRAFRRVGHLDVTHRTTSSKAARTPRSRLFAANLLDGLIRHNNANHKRETIAYSKHAQALIERVAWMLDWRNQCKAYSENHDGGTPAMRRGLADRYRTVEQLLQWRLFPKHAPLSEEMKRYYWRREHAPGTLRARPHQLKYAF